MFEPQIRVVTEVKWDGEGDVEIHCDGTVWAGSKRKDFWGPDKEWESIIVPGARLRYWAVQWSRVIGFEVEIDGKWVSVWCKGNDFQTKAEREASSKAYGDFVIDEGKKIAKAIDDGKTLEQIDEIIDDGHSGNTYAWALNYGIGNATDKAKAEIIRKAHNLKWDVTEGEGLVNPAVVTINSD